MRVAPTSRETRTTDRPVCSVIRHALPCKVIIMVDYGKIYIIFLPKDQV
jgi:hypothetical protein